MPTLPHAASPPDALSTAPTGARAPGAAGAVPDAFAVMLEQLEADVWSGLHARTTPAERAALGVTLERRGATTLLAAARVDVLAFNRVVGLGVGTPASEEEVAAVVAAMRATGARRFFVQLAPTARPTAAAEWLLRHGFRVHNRWAKLYCEAAPLDRPPTRLQVMNADSAWAERFARLVAPAFDWPAAMIAPLARLVSGEGWHLYFALDGRTPVAAAAMRVREGLGYLGPAVTLPAHRGRGAQAALIARRVNDAVALGCHWLVTETAEDTAERPAPSFRNMRRAGFTLAYHRPNYLLAPGATAAA